MTTRDYLRLNLIKIELKNLAPQSYSKFQVLNNDIWLVAVIGQCQITVFASV